MKVYTKVVMDWDGNVIEEASYDYDGPVSEAKGGGGSTTSTTVQKADPWSGVQPYLTKGYRSADEMFQAGALGGPTYFPGQTFVNRTPLENQAQMERLGFSLGPMRGQAAELMGAQSRMLNAGNVYGNPAVEGQIDAVQRRLNQNLLENQLPGIRSGSIAAGQLGGSRQAQAEAGAIGRTQDAIGDAAANIYGNAYGEGLKAQAAGMQYAPTAMRTALMPFDVMGDVGAYQRGEQELALQEDMSRYQYNQQRDVQNLQNYMNLLQGSPWGSTSTGTMPGRESGGFSGTGALGGALGGYSLGSALGGTLFGLPAGPFGAVAGGLLGGLF